MELKDFVSRTLVDVRKGVELANAQVEKDRQGRGLFYLGSGSGSTGDLGVEFDVAVTVSSTETTGAGGGVQIAVFKAQLGGEDKQSHEQFSRIRFRVLNRFIEA